MARFLCAIGALAAVLAQDSLEQWLDKNGANMSRIRIVEDPKFGGKSLVAAEDIPLGEAACMIPKSIMINYNTALQTPLIGPIVEALYSGDWIGADGVQPTSQEVEFINFNINRDTDKIYAAILFLHFERFVTQESRFAPYLDSLPATFPTMLYSIQPNSIAASMLQETPWLNELAASKQQLLGQITEFFLAILRQFPTVYGDLDANPEARARRAYELRWCWTVSETRAFGPRFTGDVHSMYPLLDLSNHDHNFPAAVAVFRGDEEALAAEAAAAGANNESSVATGPADGIAALERRFMGAAIINGANRALHVGEQVWSSYQSGGRENACNARMLAQYGFTDELPASDCARVLLRFPALSPWNASVEDMLRRTLHRATGVIPTPGNTSESSPFDVHSIPVVIVKGKDTPPQIFKALRINNMQITSLSKLVEANWDGNSVISIDNELASYRQLISMIAAVKADYGATLQGWQQKRFTELTDPHVQNILQVHLGAIRTLDWLQETVTAGWNSLLSQGLPA